jgi:ABC-2 type transport system ATP-binding protein
MVRVAIRTENLTRSFGPVRAVSDLTLEVPSGIIFGFLGPNGAGKTTTIRLLLGLLRPTSGQAQVMGFDTRVQSSEICSRAGVLLEHSGLYERLSAEDNLEFYSRIWRIPSRERKGRIKRLLTHLGLWERRKEVVGTWSRGMKQKLALARALVHQPSLLFLDEPTAGLDPAAAMDLRHDLAALASQEGVTVFLTTHNLAEAERLCEQVGVIREGILVASGPPDQLRARVDTPRLEIVGRGFGEKVLRLVRERPEVVAADLQNGHLQIDLYRDQDATPLIGLIANSGATVEEVLRNRASLEQVFLTLMKEEEEEKES